MDKSVRRCNSFILYSRSAVFEWKNVCKKLGGKLITSFKIRSRNLPSIKRNIMKNQNCDSIPSVYCTAQQPRVGQGFLIIETWHSHSDTPHSVGVIWMSDQPRRRDLYLTTHNTNKRQTDMTPARFEPSTPASERPQTQAVDRAAIGTG